jgi:predicted dinucleotide-binding enzyme
VAGQSLDVFIAGDDADAKATVAKLAGTEVWTRSTPRR